MEACRLPFSLNPKPFSPPAYSPLPCRSLPAPITCKRRMVWSAWATSPPPSLLPPPLQIFARPNNLQAAHGWVGLGNQLNGSRITETELRERYVAVYGTIKEPDPSKPAP